jgi:hypothetical protein
MRIGYEVDFHRDLTALLNAAEKRATDAESQASSLIAAIHEADAKFRIVGSPERDKLIDLTR